MHTNKLRIRLDINGEYKSNDFPSSYENLCMITNNLFNLNDDEIINQQYTYIDEEGDKVDISNSFDLEQAYLFAEKENLSILNIHIENVYEVDDLINETTESIKCVNEEDHLFRDIEKNKLIHIIYGRVSMTKSEMVKNILKMALKLNRILYNKNNKIYNKKICERNLIKCNKTNINNNLNENNRLLLNENELKEIVKKVIEEEMAIIKPYIIEKSIKKSIELLIIKRRTQFHYNKNIHDEKFRKMEEKRSPFLSSAIKTKFWKKISTDRSISDNNENLYSNKNKTKNNFDPHNVNPKLFINIMHKSKGNLDDAINYIFE